MTNEWQLFADPLTDEANALLDAAMTLSIEERDPTHVTKLMHTKEMRNLGAADSEPRNEFYDRWEAAHGEGWMGLAEEAWHKG